MGTTLPNVGVREAIIGRNTIFKGARTHNCFSSVFVFLTMVLYYNEGTYEVYTRTIVAMEIAHRKMFNSIFKTS